MIKKRVILASIILLATLAYLVSAIGSESMRIISPASGTNFTNLTNVVFNVSYLNLSDITNPLNATFFLNISGIWTAIGNTSSCTSNACFATLSNNTIPDGVYSLNATISNGTSSATVSMNNTSNLSSLIYIDNTRPIVFAENFSNPLTGGNYSQNLVINVSIFDATIGVETVFFNITNSSGQQNSTVTASLESGTPRYSVIINTTHYPDGNYNITVYANDSVNNLNNSAVVYQLIFDNTLPVITHSCDDYSVAEDDDITCTCNTTDPSPVAGINISGIDLSYGTNGVSFTASPSTSNTGNNKETVCTSKDKAGNLQTSTLKYNVTSTNSGSSTGGSSSGGTSSNSTQPNTTSNSTNQNSSSDEGNSLQGNQQNQGDNIKDKPKINYILIVSVLVGAGLIVTIVIFTRKRLLQRVLNSKTSPSFKR